jgi:hypothetical protein
MTTASRDPPAAGDPLREQVPDLRWRGHGDGNPNVRKCQGEDASLLVATAVRPRTESPLSIPCSPPPCSSRPQG